MPCGYECLICWSSVGSQCGRPVVPAPSWEWQEDRTDCDSSYCGWALGLFLPPGSRCSFTLSKGTRCHLSAYLPVPWGAGWRRSCRLRKESLCDFICHVEFLWPIISHTWQEADDVDGSRRLMGHPSRSSLLWTEAGDQLSSDAPPIPRPWGQEVGLEDKSHFSTCMSAASSHFASSLTFSIQRALIWNEGD